MKVETKTVAELSVADLIKVIEDGTFSGKKIKSLDWRYKNVMVDAGRGNPTYNREVVGLVLEFKA